MAPTPASTEAPFDLVIQAGRVLCPATGLDGPGAVAVTGGRIAAAGPSVDGPAREVLRLPHALVVPGLVDLHAHPARGESRYGVDPDIHLLPFGTTTVLAQGEAGALNLARYQTMVLEPSLTRVRLAVNIGRRGEATPAGSCEALEDVDAAACAEAVRANQKDGGAAIWGLAVNVSQATCGRTDPRAVMAAGLGGRGGDGAAAPLRPAARRRLGARATARAPPPRRRRHVLLHRLSRRVSSTATASATRSGPRASGGSASTWATGWARSTSAWPSAPSAEGFLPDAISTDRYQRHLALSPRHDLPRTLSKLLAAGMTEPDVFLRVTTRPAAILGLAGEIGTLAPGACADLAALEWNPAAPPLRDTAGAERPGGAWEPVLTVRAGRVIPVTAEAAA